MPLYIPRHKHPIEYLYIAKIRYDENWDENDTFSIFECAAYRHLMFKYSERK